MSWEADVLARSKRGDLPDVDYERISGHVDPAVTAEIEAWHLDLLASEGRLAAAPKVH